MRGLRRSIGYAKVHGWRHVQNRLVGLSHGGEQAEFRHRHRVQRERLASGVLPDDQTS
jgi:hypothetical protein